MFESRGWNNAAMLIVDANNVLHAAGDGRSPDGVVRLMEAVMRSRYAAREVVLVSDGTPGRMTPGAQAVLVRVLAGRTGARVVYSGPEREADDVIEGMIAGAADASRVLVVSSDARLGLAAYRAGAKSVSAGEFLGQLEKDREKMAARELRGEDGLDAGSVAWWMEYFGYGAPTGRGAPVAVGGSRTTRPMERAGDEKQAGKRGGTGRADLKAEWDWLTEASRMWPGVFHPDQLDMERWLREKEKGRRKGERPEG